MNTRKSIALKALTLSIAGAISIIGTATSFADPLPPGTLETPGVVLAPGTAALPNLTFVDSRVEAFTSQFGLFSGTLTSVVLQDTVSGFLNFYYQIANTSTAPVDSGADIFRIGIDGYGVATTGLDADFRTDGLAGVTGAPAFVVGTEGVYSADRQPFVFNGVGFDFDFAQFVALFPGDAPANVDSGETSFYFYVNTTSTVFNSSFATISGAESALNVATFAPIPEPSSVLFGMAIVGVLFSKVSGRSRKLTAV